MPKKYLKILLIISGVLLILLTGFATHESKVKKNTTTIANAPTPKKEEPFGQYTPPKIPKKDVYTIFMVGDSMTEVLGPHGGKLSELLNEVYKSTPGNQRIVMDNYAKGSTNILGLQTAMQQKAVIDSKEVEPLLSRSFDLILIESFGYNPLSQFGLENGLKEQTKTLDELMKLLTKTHPDSLIVFVATIAPNEANFAEQEQPGKTFNQRKAMADERMEYIKNHMAYAKSHNIPLIDIFTKSLTSGNDGNLTYINPNDHIHPSFAGIDFINHEIANYIYDNQLLPR